jgi:citrate lyase beta subunit
VEEGVALSPRLFAYLTLERAMLELDEQNDPLADRLRDAMDPLWIALSDAEHTELDARDFRLPKVERATPGTTAEVGESSAERKPARLLKADAGTISGTNLEAA